MSRPTLLSDARDAARKAHAAKVRKLFEDHPELAEEALIVAPQAGVTLTPEWMGTIEIVGTLEAAKFSVLMASLEDG